jgi:hypothetical protein
MRPVTILRNSLARLEPRQDYRRGNPPEPGGHAGTFARELIEMLEEMAGKVAEAPFRGGRMNFDSRATS